MADWDHIRTLMRAVTEDGEGSWQLLLTELEPELVRFAKRQPIGRLRDHEDSPREIVMRVVARLHANDHASLRAMFREEAPPHPRAWIRVIVRRAAIDYMREQPEYVRGTGGDGPRWMTLVSLITGDGVSDPDTLAQKRREVIAFVTAAVKQAAEAFDELGEDGVEQVARQWRVPRIHVRRLVNKGQQLIDVLQSVLEGLAHTDVADRLSLSRRDVQLGVKYIEELLAARKFGLG